MAIREATALLKALTATCILAMQAAAALSVARRNYEIGLPHFLLALLSDDGSDLATLFAIHQFDRDQVKAVLERHCDELPTGNSARPTFSPLLLQWFDDSLSNVTLPSGATRIRSAALLSTLLHDPARYQAAAIVAPWLDPPNGKVLSVIPLAKEAAEAVTKPLASQPGLERRWLSHPAAEGEDLHAIARRYAVDVEDVAQENALRLDWSAPEAGCIVRVRVLTKLFPSN